KFRAGALNNVGNSKSLFAVLDGAWPSDDGKRSIANLRAVAKIENRALRPQIERDQFVWLGHANRFRHARQVFEVAEVDRALIAGHANGGARRARHDVRAKTERLDNADNAVDLRFRGTGVHYNQHKIPNLTS